MVRFFPMSMCMTWCSRPAHPSWTGSAMLALLVRHSQGSGSCSLGRPEQLTRPSKQYWTVQDLQASDLKPFHVHVNLQLSLAQVPMLPTHDEQLVLKPLAWIWLLMQDWSRASVTWALGLWKLLPGQLP